MRIGEIIWKQRGSALLLTLWAIVLVAMIVGGVVLLLEGNQDEQSALLHAYYARTAAESGIAIAMHPSVEKRDPLLEGKLGMGATYQARVTSEGGRLNINVILKERREEVLVRLFEGWGLSDAEIRMVLSSWLDWMAGKEPGQVDREGDEGRFLNRSFTSFDQVMSVEGMHAVIGAQPRWKDYFSLWSDGKLDLNDASADVVAAVCDISRAQAESFIQQREEMKVRMQKEEKRGFATLSEAVRLLGISSGRQQLLEGVATVSSEVMRAESTGKAGNQECSLVGIFRRGGGAGGLFCRFER